MKRTSPYSSSSLFPGVTNELLPWNQHAAQSASSQHRQQQPSIHFVKEHLKTAPDPLLVTCVFCFSMSSTWRTLLPPSLFFFQKKHNRSLCLFESCAQLHSGTHCRGHSMNRDIIEDNAKIEDWPGSGSSSNSRGLDLPGQARLTKQSECLGG